MDIHFTGHHLEITPALKTFTEEKLNRHLIDHFDKITSVHVSFRVEKLNRIAEANIHVAKETLHASAESEDMYVAVNELIHKLERLLIKHKEKLQDHH